MMSQGVSELRTVCLDTEALAKFLKSDKFVVQDEYIA